MILPKLSSLKSFLYIGIGILIGILYNQRVIDYMPSIFPFIITILVTIFIILIIFVVVLPKIFNFYLKRYTGVEGNIDFFVSSIQDKVTHITDNIADNVFINLPSDIKHNIKKDLPNIIYYLFFSRLRTTGLRFLMTVFTAIVGIIGTILLFNQNQLLNKQNEKIDNQILLEEANRRSSLIVLMSNILEKVDIEIEHQKLKISLNDLEYKRFSLSQSLIGQITALSHSFKPYRYMRGDTLISKPLSPERAQLLITLINLPLDTTTFKQIYKTATFEYADLSGVVLNGAYLDSVNLFRANLNNAKLNKANLHHANLGEALLDSVNFAEANLSQADLYGTSLQKASFFKTNIDEVDLYRSDLRNANFHGIDFSKGTGVALFLSDLSMATIKGSNLQGVNIYGSKLNGTNLEGTNLNSVDLEEASLIGTKLTINQALQVKTLYKNKGLHDSIKVVILKLRPELLKPPR